MIVLMDLKACAQDTFFIVSGVDLEYTKKYFKTFMVNDGVDV